MLPSAEHRPPLPTVIGEAGKDETSLVEELHRTFFDDLA